MKVNKIKDLSPKPLRQVVHGGGVTRESMKNEAHVKGKNGKNGMSNGMRRQFQNVFHGRATKKRIG